MIVQPTSLPEVLLVKPRVFRDERGHFVETWRESEYTKAGMGPFVQDNVSMSRRGVLRGLHLQQPHGQAKLVSALRGSVFDVAVDVRVGSPRFGKWVGLELSDKNCWQLHVPVGFAHGFQALTDDAVVCYKVSEYYAQPSELTIRWNDQRIGICWPISDPLVAAKDQAAPLLSELDSEWLPKYRG